MLKIFIQMTIFKSLREKKKKYISGFAANALNCSSIGSPPISVQIRRSRKWAMSF